MRVKLLIAPVLWLALVSGGCGDDEDPQPGTTLGGSTSLDDDGETGDATTDQGDPTTATSAAESDADTTTADDATESTASSDTAGGARPVQLYRGAVANGSVPQWDADDPRPLLMAGREGDTWVATLARIGADGELSDNLAEEIVVWGWDADPPRLYDGPVIGGAIPQWAADEPMPVVMLAHRETDTSWTTTLASIGPDGSLGDNVADRVIVWGWDGTDPDAPGLRYEGTVADGTLPGWDPDAPDPLVFLGTAGFDVWLVTLARIGPDGALSDNFATEIRVWGWN